jgi:glycosyltransferase involved in cell wall biosynthesis
VAIVAFASGMAGVSVPSRMYNILAAGKPLIAVCDQESELAMVVREEEIGWVVEPGDEEALLSALRQSRHNPELLRNMGEKARKAAVKKYTRANVVAQYKSIFESMGRD